MSGNVGGHPNSNGADMNTASLLRLGLFGSVAFLIASTLPQDLMAASLSSLLWVGAMVSALVAALLGDSLRARHLTRWDEAAVLMLASMVLGFFVDTQALVAQVEGLRG